MTPKGHVSIDFDYFVWGPYLYVISKLGFWIYYIMYHPIAMQTATVQISYNTTSDLLPFSLALFSDIRPAKTRKTTRKGFKGSV